MSADRDERIEVLKRLIPDQDRKWLVRFFLMLTLSVTIAVMGLANSVAVVIGAMLIAPPATPIMSFSAAVGLGLGRRFRPRLLLASAHCGHSCIRSCSLVAEP